MSHTLLLKFRGPHTPFGVRPEVLTALAVTYRSNFGPASRPI